MPDTHTARDLIRRYVRLLGDWWTPPELTERRTEEVYQSVRAEVLAEWTEQAAQALLAVDPVEWALAGQHAGADAARLLRRLAAAPTTPTTKEK